MKNCHW